MSYPCGDAVFDRQSRCRVTPPSEPLVDVTVPQKPLCAFQQTLRTTIWVVGICMRNRDAFRHLVQHRKAHGGTRTNGRNERRQSHQKRYQRRGHRGGPRSVGTLATNGIARSSTTASLLARARPEPSSSRQRRAYRGFSRYPESLQPEISRASGSRFVDPERLVFRDDEHRTQVNSRSAEDPERVRLTSLCP
jgi:hypothetical protein